MSIGAPSATETGFRLRLNTRIELRDGLFLAANLYLPRELARPAPCIFAVTPYGKHRNHPRASFFAARGYPFLVVDCRGRGDSDGEFSPYIQESADGADIVAWLASQEFCDGRVAMFSGSYEGYAQWAVARAATAHLATIVPAMAAAPGLDFPMRNNIFYPYALQWLALTAGRSPSDRIFEDHEFWRSAFLDWRRAGTSFKQGADVIGTVRETFDEWVSHPMLDDYWDAYLPRPEDYARMDFPILTLTGAYDGDQIGALHFYREHLRFAPPEAAEQHHLVIGPWDHRGVLAPKPAIGGLEFGADALVDIMQLHLDWYDWRLRDGPRPHFLRKRVCVYVSGCEEWRYADRLEDLTIGQLKLFPASTASGARLLPEPAATPPSVYVFDPSSEHAVPRDLATSYVSVLRPTFPLDDPTEQHDAEAASGVAFDSDAFVDGLEVCGFFKLTAWISIDQPDADFRAAIYEVEAGGRTILLTSDIKRARHRDSLRSEVLVETTDPLLYTFATFTFIARRLAPRSRLQLVVGPLDAIFDQLNRSSGAPVASETAEDARPVRVRIHHDERHPSVLEVPLCTPTGADA